MAVVVQEMVPSEVSGILFTSNPATGERSELIINASFGLGEAVVGGQVTPDTYIVNRNDLTDFETILGPKEHQVVYDGDQGVRLEEVKGKERDISSLSDKQVQELCKTALDVESLYEGTPQDVEWAFVMASCTCSNPVLLQICLFNPLILSGNLRPRQIRQQETDS